MRTGKITVTKATDPSGQDDEFRFNVLGSRIAFSLKGGETSQQYEFEAGSTRTIEETLPDGWKLEEIKCTCAGQQPVCTPDLTNKTVDVTVVANKTINVTFCNTKCARYIVRLFTDPSGSDQQFNLRMGGPDYLDEFVLVDGATFDSGFTVPPGTGYGLSIDLPDDWQLDSATCNNGDPPGDITFGAGETVIHTINVSMIPDPIPCLALNSILSARLPDDVFIKNMNRMNSEWYGFGDTSPLLLTGDHLVESERRVIPAERLGKPVTGQDRVIDLVSSDGRFIELKGTRVATSRMDQ